MINLIPPSAEKLIVKEYWLRVLAVWLFLFGTGCLIVASLHLPTYVLLSGELASLRAQIENSAAETATFDTGSAALTKAMKEARLLQSVGTSSSRYVFDINTLTTIAGADVNISAFAFTTTEQATIVTLSGTALTRASLANFRDAIELNEQFVDAILPISSLIKDRNIEFTMTVTSTRI